MKNKNLLIGLCSVPLLLSISTNMIAQDLREQIGRASCRERV